MDLGGWSLSDGVDFEFPPGTILNDGEFLIVARDADSLAAKFPEIDIAGQWNGSLSRKGERLRLIDASKNPVDEIRFYDGGRWPEAAARNVADAFDLAERGGQYAKWASLSIARGGDKTIRDFSLNGDMLADAQGMVQK